MEFPGFSLCADLKNNGRNFIPTIPLVQNSNGSIEAKALPGLHTGVKVLICKPISLIEIVLFCSVFAVQEPYGPNAQHVSRNFCDSPLCQTKSQSCIWVSSSLSFRPVRQLPGVGMGTENNASIYRIGGVMDGNFEKSPYQRVPLGLVPENTRSGLLSGVQRVLVNKQKSQVDSHVITPPQRSPNNFMKPTESSR